MRTWPHGSVHVPVDVLAVGDIVVVPAAGAYRIDRLITVPPLGTVALLGWDDLALILRAGSSRERLNPAPHAHRPRPAAVPGVPSRVRPDQHRLAG